MNLNFFVWFLVLLPLLITQTESRKVTQAAKKAPPPPPPPKKDKSWVRSKIDSAKEKYEAGKQKIKTKIEHAKEKYDHAKDKVKSKISMGSEGEKSFVPKTTPRKPDLPLKTTPRSYGWNSNVRYDGANGILTTKKPLFDRIKEKAKGSEKYVGKAVGWAKKDLGIGVEGPKKPSKILKFGKKAVEFVFKKKSKKVAIGGGSSGAGVYSDGYSSEGVAYSGGSYFQDQSSSDLHEKVEFLRSRLQFMQNKIQDSWNTSEAGTKYKLFEERKSWNDAQLHCEELGSNLAYLDSESKNNYARQILDAQNITMVWFGLRTEIGSEAAGQSQEQFSNFAHLDGCGVVDRNGTWSISSCSMELPYLCQAFRFDVLVEIPYNK